MQKSYQYILLDWDGNLAKTLDVWMVAFGTPLKKRGIHKTDHEIAASFGQFWQEMQAWGVSDPDVVMQEASDMARELLTNVELYPDALAVLEELHQRGKVMALITSSSHVHIQHVLAKFGMNYLFKVIIANDDVAHHKPHPEPLDKAMALLSADKDQTVMIGDSDKDLGAAKNAGVDSILFHVPEHEKFYPLAKLKTFSPTYVVDDFKKVLDIAG